MRSPRWLAVATTVLLAAFFVPGCGGDDSTATPAASTTSAPVADALNIIVPNYPLAEFVNAAGGNRVAVTNLATPGVEPHDVELTGQQVQDLNSARMIVVIPGYQHALDDAIDATGTGDRVLDATAGLTLLEGEEPEAAGHDPHVWLDPTMAQRIVTSIAARLGELSPADAASFTTNAAAYNAKLATLDAEYQQGLATCARRDIVTSHAAFGYLAARYNLHQEPITGLSPDAEPSPQQLEDIVHFVEDHDVKVIFFEELVSSDLSQTIAGETGARTMVLSPIENRTEEQEAAGKDLLVIARDNLANLRDALECT